jgi:hypothetical protein
MGRSGAHRSPAGGLRYEEPHVVQIAVFIDDAANPPHVEHPVDDVDLVAGGGKAFQVARYSPRPT